MKALCACMALMALTLLPSSASAVVEGEFEAVVTWVIDGDSIRFRPVGSSKADECRMLHYNAPEMTGPERPMGRRATRKLIGLIKGRRVHIWGLDRDRYGRLLCEVRLVDGTYINDIMREFLKDYAKRDIYLKMEKGQKTRVSK